jgi:glycosyltransferase involved in cell wall biosynthesis
MVVISIIIPSYNEEENINLCISSLLKQDFEDFEIIIVDDGSKDKTKEIVRKFIKKSKKIKLIEGEHKGPGFSRNLGAKKAHGKILVFVDSDMAFDKSFIKNLTKPILEKKAIGTEDGRQRALNPDKIWSKCWGIYIVKGEGNKKRREGQIFRSILKEEFDKMGGFDPSLGYADDLTFYQKFGIRSKVVNDALCYHKNPETLEEVYKQSKWIGASIENKFVQNKISPFFLILLSPLLVPIFSAKKCYENKNYSLFFPWMIIFMIARYFGTIHGIINKNYLSENTR